VPLFVTSKSIYIRLKLLVFGWYIAFTSCLYLKGLPMKKIILIVAALLSLVACENSDLNKAALDRVGTQGNTPVVASVSFWESGKNEVGSRFFWENGTTVGSKFYWENGTEHGSIAHWNNGGGPGSLDRWENHMSVGSLYYWENSGGNGRGRGSLYYWENGKAEGSKEFWDTGKSASIIVDSRGNQHYFLIICHALIEDETADAIFEEFTEEPMPAICNHIKEKF